jgi:hypothetical protein
MRDHLAWDSGALSFSHRFHFRSILQGKKSFGVMTARHLETRASRCVSKHHAHQSDIGNEGGSS